MNLGRSELVLVGEMSYMDSLVDILGVSSGFFPYEIPRGAFRGWIQG